MPDPPVDPPVDPVKVADRFRWFADEECGHLPLYDRLCRGAAEDRELLELVATARHRQWRPNLLLAAVHDLLLAGADHELAAWYPTCSAGALPAADPFPVFRSFVFDHVDAVRYALATRATQTNEANRSWLWRTGLAATVEPDRPVALVELGASAGLNLLVDRYRYGPDDEGPGPLLVTRSLGAPPPDGPLPPIVARLGVDLEPVDVADERAVRWLKACIWPEQPERHDRFDQAVALARLDPPPLVAADLLDGLDGAIAAMPADALVVVTCSWTLTYLTRERRAELDAALDRIGRERDLVWLCAEAAGVQAGVEPPPPTPTTPTDTHPSILHASTWTDGERRDRVMARCHPHLEWTEWLA